MREADHERLGPPVDDQPISQEKIIQSDPIPKLDIPAVYDNDQDVQNAAKLLDQFNELLKQRFLYDRSIINWAKSDFIKFFEKLP